MSINHMLLGPICVSANPSSWTAFTTAGADTYVVPAGVKKISILCIGGGGSGATDLNAFNEGGGGGGGGALAYSNDVVVTPGETLTISVGAGGAAIATSDANGNNGGNSSAKRGGVTLVEAVGGGGGIRGDGNFGIGGAAGSCTGDVSYSGGNGGFGGSSESGGGGGAAGYSGNGGAGGDSDAGASGNAGIGGGAGAGGPGDSSNPAGGGGGVGILGEGSNGVGGVIGGDGIGDGGTGGSGGTDGGDGTASSAGNGGDYGGGGGGASDDSNESSGAGGTGAVVIISGAEYVWPTPPAPPPPPPVSTLGLHELGSFQGGAGAVWNIQQLDLRHLAGCQGRWVFSWEIDTVDNVYYEDFCLDQIRSEYANNTTIWTDEFGTPAADWETTQAAAGASYTGQTWDGIKSPNTDNYWCSETGPTTSAGTGNVSPVTGGTMVYTETSSPVASGDVFWMRSQFTQTLPSTVDHLIIREARDTVSPNSILKVYFDVTVLA